MKKMVMLLIFAFLITGCNINYELNIDRQLNLLENITMNATTDEDIQKILKFNQYVPVNIEFDDPVIFKEKKDGVEYYSINRKSDNSQLKFSYSYDVNQFNYNMIARSCYQYVTVMNQKDKKTKKTELLLSTSKKFLCFDKYDNLDDVSITITSKYKLKETNADVVEKHKYIWNINKANANNKYIYLSLDTTKRDLTLWEKIQEGEYTNIFTISILLFIVGVIIYIFLKKKGDRKNKI